MKVIKNANLEFTPAAHEDPANPGVFKKVLLKKGDLIKGEIAMVNWCRIPPQKSFTPHYHESLEEVFIIISGQVTAKVDGVEAKLQAGDALVTSIKETHQMTNESDQEVLMIAFGITTGEPGQTIIVN